MSGFLIVWILTPPNQIEVKYSHHECKDKSILIERTLKLAKIKKKTNRKNRKNVCCLTKTSKVYCRKFILFLCAFLKVFKLLSMCAKFQVNK